MTFEEVCKDLNLANTPDWGISNPDSTRVYEFINYAIIHSSFDRSIQFEFVELIIASINDAILESINDCEMNASFYNYIKVTLKNKRFFPQIEYWISIKSMDEYPVGFLLESYVEN